MGHIRATATPEYFLEHKSGFVMQGPQTLPWFLLGVGEVGGRGGVSGKAWELGRHLPIPSSSSSRESPIFPC